MAECAVRVANPSFHQVTFVRRPDGTALLEPWWPGRLMVDGIVLGFAQEDDISEMTYDGEVLRFNLVNATATYRLIGPTKDASLRKYGVFEFDCIACSRDMTDG